MKEIHSFEFISDEENIKFVIKDIPEPDYFSGDMVTFLTSPKKYKMILIETDDVVDELYIRNLQMLGSKIFSDYADWGGYTTNVDSYLSQMALIKKRNISYFFTRGEISRKEILDFCKDQNIKFSHFYIEKERGYTFIVVEDINDYAQFKLAFSPNISISKLHSIDILGAENN